MSLWVDAPLKGLECEGALSLELSHVSSKTSKTICKTLVKFSRLFQLGKNTQHWCGIRPSVLYDFKKNFFFNCSSFHFEEPFCSEM